MDPSIIPLVRLQSIVASLNVANSGASSKAVLVLSSLAVLCNSKYLREDFPTRADPVNTQRTIITVIEPCVSIASVYHL